MSKRHAQQNVENDLSIRSFEKKTKKGKKVRGLSYGSEKSREEGSYRANCGEEASRGVSTKRGSIGPSRSSTGG